MASVSPSTFKADLRGAVPPEWIVCSLGEIGSLGSGTTPSRAKFDAYYSGGTTTWVKTGDLTDGDILETAERITEEAVQCCGCKIYPPGTVLIAMYGGFNQIGRTGLLRLPAATNQAITAIVVDPGVLLPTLLQEWLNLQVGFWRRLAASSRKDPNITKDDVSQFPVPIPPMGEQTRMATLAAVFQQKIASVQKLKDLNRLLFMGHRKRLLQPGSDGDGWTEYRLGDLFTERSETARADLPLLSITADRGVISRGDVDRKDSSSDDKTKYKRIARGDIGYNTMRMWQGVSALSTLEGIVSPAYTICAPGPLVNGHFASYLFKYPPVVNLFFRNSQGLVDDTLNLKFSNFSRIRVKVPPVGRQTVIARVLIALDQELALLERYQESIRKQKTCLMTKLLTGNISYRESARA